MYVRRYRNIAICVYVCAYVQLCIAIFVSNFYFITFPCLPSKREMRIQQTNANKFAWADIVSVREKKTTTKKLQKTTKWESKTLLSLGTTSGRKFINE